MNDKAIVKIFRFDPTVDKEGRYETYEVPAEGWQGLRVLDTLRYIYENIDPGLAFREQCYQRLCGACIVMVNKKSVLACDAQATKEMVIEPDPRYRILRDLVVDLTTRK